MSPERISQALRITGFVCGAAFAITAALTLLLWASFDARKLREEVVATASSELGRTLRIEGDLRLSVWPRPAIITGRMSLSEPGREDVFAAVQSSRFTLARWHLLLGRYTITNATLGGMELRLVRASNGTWNFADLLEAAPETQSPRFKVALDSLRADSSRVLVRDMQSGRRIEVGDLQLTTGALYARASGGMLVSGRLIEQASNTEAELQVNGGYTLDATASSGRLVSTTLQLNGQIAGLQDGDLRLGLDSLQWQSNGDSGKLAGADLRLTAAEGERRGELEAELPALSWVPDGPSADAMSARLRLRSKGGEDAEYTFKLAGLRPQAGGLRAQPVQVGWRHLFSGHGSQGTLNAPLQLDWKSETLTANPLQGEVLLLHPRLNPANARAEIGGQVKWGYATNGISTPALDARLSARLGDDEVMVDAQLAKLAPLIGRFALSGQGLDIDRLTNRRAAAADAPEQRWSPLPATSTLEGRLEMANLRVGGMLVDTLISPLRLVQGKLEIGPHKLDMYDGSISGMLAVDTAGRAVWRGSFSKLALRTLLRDSKLKAPLDGELNLQGELSAQLGALLQGPPELSGNLRFSLTDGSWRGIDMAQSLREFSPAIAERRDAARTPTASERTVIMRAAGSVVLKNGIGKLQAFSASNPWLQISGGGDLGVSQDFLDLTLRAAIGSPGPRSSAADLVKLRGKIVPLRLKGTLEKPDVRMSLSPPLRAPGAPASTTTTVKPAAAKPVSPPAPAAAPNPAPAS